MKCIKANTRVMIGLVGCVMTWIGIALMTGFATTCFCSGVLMIIAVLLASLPDVERGGLPETPEEPVRRVNHVD